MLTRASMAYRTASHSSASCDTACMIRCDVAQCLPTTCSGGLATGRTEPVARQRRRSRRSRRRTPRRTYRRRTSRSLPHPAFFNQSPREEPSGDRYRRVKGYLEHEEWWISTFGGHRHYRRPLEFYVQWLASAGLGVVDLVEPPVPVLKPESEWNDYDRWFTTIPTMLGMAARRVQPG